MPTSTFNGVALENIGPLTTTYTAPSSCSTVIDNTAVAFVDFPGEAYAYPRCDVDKDEWFRWPSLENCVPSAKALEVIDMPNDPHIRYHSPGLYCPASWTTAGVAVKQDSKSFSASGAFSPDFIDPWADATSTLDAPRVNPWPNQLASALNVGETAILCCPRGWTVHEYGRCYTNFPVESLGTSTLCAPSVSVDMHTITYSFTYFDQTVTATAIQNTGSEIPEVLEYHTFILTDTDSRNDTVIDDEGNAWDALFTGDVTGYQYLPMVVLVNGGDDDESGENDDDKGGNDDDDVEEGRNNDDNDAGTSLGPGLGAHLMCLAVAWIVGGLAYNA